MQILLIILFILVIISLVLLFSTLRIYINYSKEKKLNIALKLLWFKFNVYPLNKFISRFVDNSFNKLNEKDKQKKIEFTKLFNYVTTVISSINHKITVNELNIKMTIGINDAAETAIACGALYSSIYGSIGLIQNIIYVNKPLVQIIPIYNELTASIIFKTELKAKVISILIIALKLSNNIKKINKNKGRCK